MDHRSDFPFETELFDPVFIEMSDGTRLAAKIWLPKDADRAPVPAILEYLPYRRTDGTLARDALTHPWFAGHGYAAIRVDMRGSGDSDGVLRGEYLAQEQEDALEVIDWITRQSWCSGAVGMIGISWGGFNGLQMAARQPEALKAIVTICSTDDRYADDIHYMGGCMLMDNPWWNTYMFSINTTPPDPAMVGNRWMEIWRERLENSGFWLAEWLQHQSRDDFWKHGSVCETYADIKAAVYAVGGWADGYSNAVFRLLSNLDAPKKGLVGPWAHKYPHFAQPGPQIGFLQECLRWWDHWLKGIDTGIMDEPMLRAWVQDPVPPRTHYDHRPGKWVAEDSWPSPRIGTRPLYLTPHGLRDRPEAPQTLTISSPMTVGSAGGHWCAFGLEADLPGDQRGEAGGSLVFDSEVLSEGFDSLGAPVLDLDVASDRPVAKLAVVLGDVLPGGAVTRISYGLLNLTHRDSHESPEALEPGKTYHSRVTLNECGHHFAPGHRIRVSLSTAYWPIAWPSPEMVTLSVLTGQARLHLPERPERAEDADLPDFAPPEGAPPVAVTQSAAPSFKSTFTRDVSTGIVTHGQWVDEGVTMIDAAEGWTVASTRQELFSVHPDDPNSTRMDVTWTESFGRGAWQVETRTQTVMTSTPTDFLVKAHLQARVDGEIAQEKTWDISVPRDHN